MNTIKDPDEWIQVDTPMLESLSGNTNIRAWCHDTCQGQYEVNLWHVYFEKEEDVTLFKLKWD